MKEPSDAEYLPMIYVKMTSKGPQVYVGPVKPAVKDVAHAYTDKVLDPSKKWVLPLSTGVPVLPTQSAHITACPRMLCVPNRFMISSSGTAGGAADWIVKDIKIDGCSQFRRPGDISGEMFAPNAGIASDVLERFVQFTAIQPNTDVDIIVTYVGINEHGCPLFASLDRD